MEDGRGRRGRGRRGGIEEEKERRERREERGRGGKREEREPSVDHEGSVAPGPALAQPGQLHRQFGQPAHPLF